MKLTGIINKKLPFVVYKKPLSGKLNIIQQKTKQLYTDQHFSTKGFYFTPFDLSQHPTVVFPSNKTEHQSFFIRDFNEENTYSNDITIVSLKNEPELYQKKIQKAIKHIHNGNLQKIIISRKQLVQFKEFHVFSALLDLMTNYDNSFVYLWFHPLVGMWMGATPELLGKYQQGVFKTVALAGTLPVKNNEPIIWQTKEIQEQKFVENYIKNILQKYTSEVELLPPKTFIQKKVAHIQTQIKAYIKKDDVKPLILKLHPTPAVCGTPLNKAIKIIPEIEAYDRKYYTGFLGEFFQEKIELYVNLRCMEMFKSHFYIYTGGGIIASSNSEKEWNETQLKAEILLSIFK